MKWYKCFVAGENFPGVLIDDKEPVGFYTTRFVQAVNGEDAEMKVLESLRHEESLKLPEGGGNVIGI
jgi:hypothetical protein